MGRLALVVVVLGGCGRVAFEELPDGGPIAPPPRFVSGDVTGDGTDDLIVGVAGYAGVLEVFAGGPGFAGGTPAARISGDAGCTITAPWLLVDENRDGLTDLVGVVACAGTMNLQVIDGPLAPGDGFIASVGRRIQLSEASPVVSLAVADLTGDGRVDIAVGQPDASGPAGAAAGVVTIYADLAGLGSAPSPFTVFDGETAGQRLGGTFEPKPSDLTGDGVGDLVVGSSGVVYVFASPLAGVHESAGAAAYARIDGLDPGHGRVGLATGDLDRDGHDDLLVGTPHDDRAGLNGGWVSMFRGALSPGARLASSAEASISGKVAEEYGEELLFHADLDGDGDLDLLDVAAGLGMTGTGGVWISYGVLVGVLADPSFTSRAAGQYDLSITGDAQTSPRFGTPACAGDIDADGRMDIASSVASWNADQGRVYVYLGRPTLAIGTATSAADVLLDGTPGTRFGTWIVSR